MDAIANVAIHSSQFPENVRRDLLRSLRSQKIAHKFHYDSVKQTQKWLALHQQFSPSRNDEDCREIYEQGFKAVTKNIRSRQAHLIGLGCGGGRKDTRLLKNLKQAGREIFYTPCDVATAMVLAARQTALAAVQEKNCFPFVCDLETADNLSAAFDLPVARKAARIITFFGMLPNSEPGKILPKLASLMGPKDFLLFSANLAPGHNYDAGMKKILPQYDNVQTRDWLMTFILDLGIEKADGEMSFEVETKDNGLKRIVANFKFKRQCRIEIEDKPFVFRRGETVRLFFSYRFTPERVVKILSKYRLAVCEQWITKSAEEGVFLCHKI